MRTNRARLGLNEIHLDLGIRRLLLLASTAQRLVDHMSAGQHVSLVDQDPGTYDTPLGVSHSGPP
jgi:hypothetical protein